MSSNQSVHRIAIVGTGVIGASWAAYYLSRGFDVVATDPGPQAEKNLRKYVDDAWPLLTEVGLSPGASRDRMTFSLDMSRALAEADWVQENAPERPDFNIKLFAQMDEATPPTSIIASSSSGITMDVIQSGCKRPERCVIGHPFNPPHIVPLVEVVGGAKTSEATIERAMAFYAAIGKKPGRQSARARRYGSVQGGARPPEGRRDPRLHCPSRQRAGPGTPRERPQGRYPTQGAAIAAQGTAAGAPPCATCHALTGGSDGGGSFPRIAGQSAFYLSRQLRDFVSGIAPDTVMSPIARTLTADNIEDVAAYYETLKRALHRPQIPTRSSSSAAKSLPSPAIRREAFPLAAPAAAQAARASRRPSPTSPGSMRTTPRPNCSCGRADLAGTVRRR